MDSAAPRAAGSAALVACLRLIRSENVGPVTFRQLMARFGTADAALAALPELARRGGRRRPIAVASRAAAEREVAAMEALGGQFLTLGDADYPPALAALDDAPPVLAVLGHPHLLKQNAVAMVGARNGSANGRRLARQLAAELGQGGLVVVSGLARGIDAAAHEGALKTGTVAVVAGGVDVVYPEQNTALYEEIRARGTIVSEMPPGTVPQARHFPRRNRLISGCALGTLVVEAALRSGSLITARYAADQGREVLAVPGSPLDPRARGCNGLLRQGAVLVETARDVMEALSGPLCQPIAEAKTPEFQAAPPFAPSESALADARREVESLIGPTPVVVDELIRQCQVSAALVQMVMLELELAGRAERHPGNRIAAIAGVS